MRERLAALLLALLWGTSPALAQQDAVTPAVAPAQAGPAQEEAPPEEPQAEEALPEEEEDAEANVIPGYQEVPSQDVNLGEGDLRATLGNGALRPARGYVPLQVTLQNPAATPRVVRIGFDAHDLGRSEVVVRTVEVGPRQRLVAWLPIPVTLRGGLVHLHSPGVSFRAFNVYSVDPDGQPVLVLGSEQAFRTGTALPRVTRQPRLSVRFVPPEDAPRELAAYVGHAQVVVAGDVTRVPADVWSALEAYAATGGHLSLLRPPRDVGERLPLLARATPGTSPYGFGEVRLCSKARECGEGLLSAAGSLPQPSSDSVTVVSPFGPPSRWDRSRHLLSGGEAPLLPGVQAPVGRFLFLITLFVLAVGPGGLALARRKGPVALLIAVPSVAFLTCLAIVAWSVLMEGFSVHASRYSLTWLDRARDRAVTVGVGGYYANLEPDGVQMPALGALLGPDEQWDPQALEADWSHGMAVTGGFLPSRTYREWGEVAVVPTRARLTVRPEGQGLRVQNALGAPLAEGYVRHGGKVWALPALAEGAEGEASLAPPSASETSFSEWVAFSESVRHRFSGVPWDSFSQPLPEGGFLARLEGRGLSPTAALEVELHEGQHFVHGRVDGP